VESRKDWALRAPLHIPNDVALLEARARGRCNEFLALAVDRVITAIPKGPWGFSTPWSPIFVLAFEAPPGSRQHEVSLGP
jgi:hypothetical protein